MDLVEERRQPWNESRGSQNCCDDGEEEDGEEGGSQPERGFGGSQGVWGSGACGYAPQRIRSGTRNGGGIRRA